MQLLMLNKDINHKKHKQANQYSFVFVAIDL